MLVDAHCHLVGSSVSREQIQGTLVRAREAGVGGCICVGTHLAEAGPILELCRAEAGVQASLGVHPHEAEGWDEASWEALEGHLRSEDVRFVGETGLDWHYDFSPRAVQEDVFRHHIRLARQVGKPLMIHTRWAPEATLRVLREEEAERVGGIIHCFSEDRAFARAALDLGFHLSFSGIVTFPKSHGIQEVATWAPLDRILVETDSPYLAPVPYRGKVNEPAFVVHVGAAVARLRGLAPEALAEATTANLEALCGWSPPSA